MRLKRVHVLVKSTASRVLARRTRGWQPVAASAVAAFALAYVATGAATGRFSAEAKQVSSAARVPAALGTGVVDPAVRPYLSPKLLKEVPVGPGPVSKPVLKVLTSAAMTTALDASGIPVVALDAYQHAANVLAASDATCHLPWQLLAAIGRVESDNGQFGGAMLLPDGDTTRPIYGIPLDGRPGVALVRDADGGFVRAEGPMQFLPSTWAIYGADGNGDGKKDPNNIFDAALGAADYLCAAGGNMNNSAQEAAAVLRYNDADEYVRVVLALAARYEHGDAATVPTPTGAASTPASAPARPKTPRSAPPSSPAAAPTPTASSTAAPTPTASPTATPTAGSSATPTTPPATPAPTGTTEPEPAPSGQPSQAPRPLPTASPRAGQTVDIGWAPAMRQMVLKLLDAAKKAPTGPVRPTLPASRPAHITPPAHKPTRLNHS